MATEVRKEVIDLDNLTTSKAVDALLNFETVTLFHNQRLEVGQFYNCIKVTCTPKPALLSAADLCEMVSWQINPEHTYRQPCMFRRRTKERLARPSSCQLC